jgi:hypothetical protein
MLEKAMTLLGAAVVPLAGLVGETFPQKSFDLQPPPPPLWQPPIYDSQLTGSAKHSKIPQINTLKGY